jgi:hypothetical protein
MNHWKDKQAHDEWASTPKRRINQDIYPPRKIPLSAALHGLFVVCVLGAVVGTVAKLGEGKWQHLIQWFGSITG